MSYDPLSAETVPPNLLEANQTSSGSKLSNRAWVAITAMICGTVLLLCGGVIGLGFYAVNQLADELAFDEDWTMEDEATLLAVQFAIEEEPTVIDEVGGIVQVTEDEDLTYDLNADGDDYFYRVVGDKGEMIVVANFHEDDTTWFRSIARLDGDKVDSPQTPLEFRAVPFNGDFTKAVHDVLVAHPPAIEQLDIGELRWIEESDEVSEEANVWRLSVLGTESNREVLVVYEPGAFEEIRHVDVVDASGSRERIWTAESIAGVDELPVSPE
ncbi:MAG: hypothetical protein AAGD07_20820 [Planctomycetota bacterium]